MRRSSSPSHLDLVFRSQIGGFGRRFHQKRCTEDRTPRPRYPSSARQPFLQGVPKSSARALRRDIAKIPTNVLRVSNDPHVVWMRRGAFGSKSSSAADLRYGNIRKEHCLSAFVGITFFKIVKFEGSGSTLTILRRGKPEAAKKAE